MARSRGKYTREMTSEKCDNKSRPPRDSVDSHHESRPNLSLMPRLLPDHTRVGWRDPGPLHTSPVCLHDRPGFLEYRLSLWSRDPWTPKTVLSRDFDDKWFNKFSLKDTVWRGDC